MKTIKIATDFSRHPKGRFHPADGDTSGERFRNDYLEPILAQGEGTIEIDLDDAAGFPSSFLEEAFGGLVRLGYSVEILKKRLRIKATQKSKERHIQQIWKYISDARDKVIA